MNRKRFLSIIGILTFVFPKMSKAQSTEPELFFFKDDGEIPNSKYPLLLYKNAFRERDGSGALWLEKRFSSNNSSYSWRNGIYFFHHFHSTSHEVLGIYSGRALVQLGGEKGQNVEVEAGDIIIIPAGVGHKNMGSTNLGVVGAYPRGSSVDLMRGEASERDDALKNIAGVAIPDLDPLLGKNGGLCAIWK